MVRIEQECKLSFREKRQLVDTKRLLVGAKCHGQSMKIAPMEDIPFPRYGIIGAAQRLAHEEALLHA